MFCEVTIDSPRLCNPVSIYVDGERRAAAGRGVCARHRPRWRVRFAVSDLHEMVVDVKRLYSGRLPPSSLRSRHVFHGKPATDSMPELPPIPVTSAPSQRESGTILTRDNSTVSWPVFSLLS